MRVLLLPESPSSEGIAQQRLNIRVVGRESTFVLDLDLRDLLVTSLIAVYKLRKRGASNDVTSRGSEQIDLHDTSVCVAGDCARLLFVGRFTTTYPLVEVNRKNETGSIDKRERKC